MSVSPELRRMIRHFSLVRFASIVGEEGASVEDDVDPDAFLYGAIQAIVILAGRDLHLTLKAHFNLKDIPAVLKRRQSDTGGKDRDRAFAHDFFREYVNLAAGGIKGELQRHGAFCGISLPVITSGLDELFFSDKVREGRVTDHWRVRGAGATFVCTSAVDMMMPASLAGFTFDGAAAAAQDGALEFL